MDNCYTLMEFKQLCNDYINNMQLNKTEISLYKDDNIKARGILSDLGFTVVNSGNYLEYIDDIDTDLYHIEETVYMHKHIKIIRVDIHFYNEELEQTEGLHSTIWTIKHEKDN